MLFCQFFNLLFQLKKNNPKFLTACKVGLKLTMASRVHFSSISVQSPTYCRQLLALYTTK